jgi:hypothetical protein
MNSKGSLIVSIFQLVIGLLATAAFMISALNGGNMTKWIITLILAVAYVVLGIIGIANYKSRK